MSLKITDKINYTLVTVGSEKLDASNAPVLKSEVVLLNSRGVRNIVIDMSECAYCDSSGLRAILVANRLCDDAIGTLIITGLQPEVENIFRISMLHTILLIAGKPEDAENLLKKKENL